MVSVCTVIKFCLQHRYRNNNVIHAIQCGSIIIYVRSHFGVGVSRLGKFYTDKCDIIYLDRDMSSIRYILFR